MSEPDKPTTTQTLCPSVVGLDAEARIFGVRTGSAEQGFRIGYLTEALPVTEELTAAIAPAKPTEVFRAAAPCSEHACKHFDGANCRLAARVATMLDPVVGSLPHCAIRRHCRWFRQEGRAACLRCPQVGTEERNPSELERVVAG
jgi:hypothetical protein